MGTLLSFRLVSSILKAYKSFLLDTLRFYVEENTGLSENFAPDSRKSPEKPVLNNRDIRIFHYQINMIITAY